MPAGPKELVLPLAARLVIYSRSVVGRTRSMSLTGGEPLSWACRQCRRRVPHAVLVCPCGATRAPVAPRPAAVAGGVFLVLAGVSGLVVVALAETTIALVAGWVVTTLCVLVAGWKTAEALARTRRDGGLSDLVDRDSGLGTSWRSLFGNRSRGFWIGSVSSFLMFVVWTAATETDMRRLALPIVIAGALAGDWVEARVRQLRGVAIEASARARAMRRRVILTIGVLMFVVNILPSTSIRGDLYWSSGNSLFAGIGAVLIVLAILTKPRGEPF